MLAERVNKILTSATMQVSAQAKKLIAEGADVINLSVGELDFPTPDNIKEAGKKGIDANKTRYTVTPGTLELRNAIASKFKRDNNLDYSVNEITVSGGAKQSLFNAIMALVNPGDEVIFSSPYWVSYPEMVSLAEGKSVIIETKTEDGFRISGKKLEDAITDKTKLIILCNPSNPTGAAYNKNELEELAEVIIKHDLYVLSDEIYEKLVYDDFKFYSFAQIKPEIKERVIIVNGLSKSYSMTGWRLGYAAGDQEIIAAMNKIQSHTTSHASSISQEAAVEALNGPQVMLEKMLSELIDRRNYLYNELISIHGIKCYKSEGAFYLFPEITSLYNKQLKIESSLDLAMYLLKEAHIAVVPGYAFGAEGYIRISYATSMDNLKETIYRLKKALKKFE
ncbi:MAG: pyridoxal phosphate-dependent aminotransferase [Ignavibacteria bacterium]|nr:MAG: pyridoxal phosphate-dependent aminotransferase [Ignavibacteria bacterium]